MCRQMTTLSEEAEVGSGGQSLPAVIPLAARVTLLYLASLDILTLQLHWRHSGTFSVSCIAGLFLRMSYICVLTLPLPTLLM